MVLVLQIGGGNVTNFIEVNVSINFDINIKQNVFISMILVKTAKAIMRLSRYIIFKLRHFV